MQSRLTINPFMGSGTTGIVAKKLARNLIGGDIKPEYVEIAKERLSALRS